MLHVNRTLPSCIGYACALGCFLAGTSTLVHAQDYPPYYSQDSRVNIAATYARQQSIASGTAVVPVNTRARWTSPDGSISRYRTSTINVPKSTLRIGALSAMSRGIMHPGWQAAILAAGFIYSQTNNEIMVETTSSSDYITDDFTAPSYAHNEQYLYKYFGGDRGSSTLFDVAVDFCAGKSHSLERITDTGVVRCTYGGGSWNKPQRDYDTETRTPFPFDTLLVPVSYDDLQEIDEHIPPSLYDELWNG